MDHPNIARVLDAGQTDSGRPFFVMELVDGVPITAYCDQARLSPRARLELFAQVCAAVQHAHQKGIIHRDIKPSNVLVTKVDGRPTPKVIDFGVAKAIDQRLTERTLFTQFGGIVGTLEYMSPEQADLGSQDIDTRSDIYALGVLLYELLTGTTPLDRASLRQAGYAEILRRIQEEEPPKPSTRLSGSGDRLPSIAATRDVDPMRLTRLVRGDLDWIVMKALEKDRTRRYETASGLARDIGRYLDGDPVEACPPSRSYRLRKFARKHRAALATASAFALLLLAAAGVSTALAIAANRARGEAIVEADKARIAEAATAKQRDAATEARDAEALARRRAEAAEARARDEADKAAAINEFLTQDLLTQAEPANNAVEDRVTLLEVLDRAADKVGTRFADRPEILVALRLAIAQTYHGLASWEKAEAQSRAMLEEAQTIRDEPLAHLARVHLAHILNHVGKLDAEGLAMMESAVDGVARTLGPDHLNTLTSRGYLAAAYIDAGRTAEAIPLLELNLRASEAKLGPDDRNTLVYLSNLAAAYGKAGRTAEAIPLYEATLRAFEAKLGPDHPDTQISRNNLAEEYRSAGRTAEAIPLHEANLRVREAKLGPDHPATQISRGNLANAYVDAGRTAKAIPLLEATLGAFEAKLGPDHPNTQISRVSLANAYDQAGRTAEAIPLLEATLTVSRAKLGTDHPNTLRTIDYLAMAYLKVGRAAAAIPLIEAKLRANEAKQGPDHPSTLNSRVLLALAYEQARRPEDAEPLIRQIVDRSRAKGPGGNPTLADALASLGLNLLAQRRWAEAEPVLRECLELREKAIPDDWRTANTRSMLGGSLLGQEKYAEAEPPLLEGREGLKSRAGTIPPPFRALRLREAAERIVALYEAWGKAEQAAEWREKLKEDLSPPAATSP
ncbi:MAG: serine/threonine-protein kinase [Isosphaeraceae bacterium]